MGKKGERVVGSGVVMLLGLVMWMGTAASDPLDDFGIGISTLTIEQTLNEIVLPVVDELIYVKGNALPDDCCWQDVEVAGTRLYLQNINVPQESVQSLASVSGSDTGLLMDILVQFDLDFFLQLCEKLIGPCVTILFCNDDVSLHFELRIRTVLDLYADAEGKPVIAGSDFFFNLAIPDKDGLCFVLKSALDVAIPALNLVANKVLPPKLNAILEGAFANVSQTIEVKGPFDLYWKLSNSTASSNTGQSVQMELDVINNCDGDTVAPFEPSPPMVDTITLLDQGHVLFQLTDSFLNNLIYTAFCAKTFDFSTEANGFTIELEETQSPEMTFINSTNSSAASITLKTSVKATRFPLRVSAKVTATAHFALFVSPTGVLSFELDPNDFVVTIDSSIPPVNKGTKEKIEAAIEAAYEAQVPLINEKLANYTFQLPQIATFNDPEILYGNGYAEIAVATAPMPTSVLGDMMTPVIVDIVEEVGNYYYGETVGSSSSQTRDLGCPGLAGVGATPIECQDL
eukprot:CAMPEP_0119127218 /NCGR_PEP_ID=MMETSP1310-20130426/5851_1 /TAXON_ID=464262 /ORGANISM="Genus nov. species nov., Strain RCC2339" /LENGTH=514 /DNA_ID=CAMNT_0007117461 /DNA_START=71 /DNA_END=1615 /DNA_ORIENTATION=+